MDSNVRTYYILGNDSTKAGSPDWSAEVPIESSDIFSVANISIEQASGSVESQVFDTSLASPGFSGITWSENSPTGTDVTVKARTDTLNDMIGAADWDTIADLNISGGERYVQFLAELSSDLYWESTGGTFTYEAYIQDQVNNYPVYGFPESGGDPYVTKLDSCWIDDVEIQWPGNERICTITGYVAKKNSFGQAKVLIDGEELTKILSVHLSVSMTAGGKNIAEENYIEVEPRNTGK